MTSLDELVETVKTKEDFIHFLQQLQNDFYNNRKEWENVELSTYLNAMEGFLTDSTDKSVVKIDFTPSWKLFASIMTAASIYE